ncbi:hypothetical protein AVEN_164566-1 [Araneus ventricosus]|uniref:Uncharacterized protein n=1 Tax=Araneus ventricosus TaxID=182803 RepID=A0A4Y2B3K5_ARAVE|nr:hypothetical protein AVEN_164566-1 [Araneus ventricosus]
MHPTSALRHFIDEEHESKEEGKKAFSLNQHYSKTDRLICILETNCSLQSDWLLEVLYFFSQAKHKCEPISPKSFLGRQGPPPHTEIEILPQVLQGHFEQKKMPHFPFISP